MNNNNLDQISIQSSKRKIERFNFKHSVDTSMGIGEIQVFQCNEVQPDSRYVTSVNSTIRLDPMVAPTAGELNLHHNFLFVGMSELYPKFPALLAKKPVQFGLTMQVPQVLPNIKLKYLCALCLIGAKFTLYKLEGSEADSSRKLTLYNYAYDAAGDSALDFGYPFTTTSNAGVNFYSDIAHLAVNDPPENDMLWRRTPPTAGISLSTLFGGYNSNVINLSRVLGIGNTDLWIPTRNWSKWSFYEYMAGSSDITKSKNYISGMTDIVTVGAGDADNNDFCISFAVNGLDGSSTVVALAAVNMSDFGSRIYKLLLGMGYGFDLESDEPVSLSKFFATYMAWFNCFSPTLYQGWETTACAKLLALFDSANFTNYNDIFETPFSTASSELLEISQTFFNFIFDLADMWYTEEQDYVTAHIRGTSVASMNTDLINKLTESGTNVNGGINVSSNRDTSFEPNTPQELQWAQQTGHAFINNVLHSALDSEVLKRLYRIVNRETIAGRRIAQLLEAQGLGEYVKRCKSTFIGHDKVPIDIFDVTATSDTLQRTSGQGMYLGEYVGKGVGQSKTKRFKFRNDEIGYIIELAAIVPESGWTNGVDVATRAIKKYDFYHADADGLGMEATRKNAVCGVQLYRVAQGTTSGGRVSRLVDTFGYVPQQTCHKVVCNVLNGNFGRHSVQKAYLPYTFNKFISIGPRDVRLQDTTATDKTFYMSKLLTAEKLPIASPMYRFVGRYPWMGRFMRIFANLGRDAAASFPAYFEDYTAAGGESMRWLFCSATNDPFIVHNAYLVDYYAKMLPIEDSFGTHEDNNEGYTDMAFGKA